MTGDLMKFHNFVYILSTNSLINLVSLTGCYIDWGWIMKVKQYIHFIRTDIRVKVVYYHVYICKYYFHEVACLLYFFNSIVYVYMEIVFAWRYIYN